MPFELKIIVAVIGGLLGSVLLLLHPIGPALLVFAISPLDPIFFNLFGQIGNYVTALPILLILMKTSPATWLTIFLGTRVQVALFLFIAVGLLSHTIGALQLGPSVYIYYAQKVSGFLLVGVIAWALRNEDYLDMCAKILIVSMAIFAMISMIEFYLGIQLLPTQAAHGSAGLLGVEESENVHSSRLRGAGDSVTINRFGLQLLLPIGLAMGCLSPKVRRGLGLVPIACLIILLTALVGTISRSAMLGFLVGVAVVSVSAYRLNPISIIATAMLAIVLGGSATFVIRSIGVEEAVASRLTDRELGSGAGTRQRAWAHGFRLFADSPVVGVGYGVVETPRVKPGTASPDPHNAYIRLLAFYGLLGAAFFVYMIFVLVGTLMKNRNQASPKFEHWRPYYLAAIAALLVVNFFNSYFFDRMIFFVFGFAAALEHARRAAARARIESAQRPPDETTPAFGRPAGADDIPALT